jgi:Ca2+-binding RTX toxin-like protein
VVDELVTGSGGIDTVQSSVTFRLADTLHAKGTIEHVTLTGTGAINATGNGAANTLRGNSASNALTGGASNDIFRYTQSSESKLGTGADRIMDFDDFGDDRIDLSTVYGGTLVYKHSDAFTAAGQVRINDIAGADVIVQVNLGGTLAADMEIRLAATTLLSMAGTDFIL